MISNRSLLIPYTAPFFAYVFIASALGDYLPVEINYLLRVVACTLLLLWARKWFMKLTGPGSPFHSTFIGVGAGLVGLVVWILLLTPFADKAEGDPWSMGAFWLRLFAAGLLVPVFEEILMRGYIFRLAYQWWEARKEEDEEPLLTVLDERTVKDFIPGAWSWPALILSTVIFASGHHMYEWPAAVSYGLLMSLLWIVRKDLLSCIVAHGVTNISLGLYVWKTGSWYLW